MCVCVCVCVCAVTSVISIHSLDVNAPVNGKRATTVGLYHGNM